MHNSYDSSITVANLRGLLDRSRRQKVSGIAPEELSAYRVGLQLLDGPLTTVSDHFARELTTDSIQTEHYAPHLQKIMKTGGVYGVNNGMFLTLSSQFPEGENHTVEEVMEIKLRNRKALLRILSTYRPKERFGDLTFQKKTITRLPDHIPIMVMTGRLDPIQKGYFVLLRAIEKFAEDEIKVILTPMPVNSDDLDYFYEVACKCKGNVTVYPIRMEKGYKELQTGSTFGVMPSIYEPFGAAVEYMANGTVNIGRATGGLVDQIDGSCGFLFREEPLYYTAQNMNDYVDTSEVIQVRKINPWAQSMAESLHRVMRRASDVYQQAPDSYYKMIIQGFRKARQFTWEETARNYATVYSQVSKG
jgi:glycogen synthase